MAASDGATELPPIGRRFENLYVGFLAQVLVPLLPLVPELFKNGTLSAKTWGTMSSIYILSLAFALKGRASKYTVLFVGAVAGAAYGLDPDHVARADSGPCFAQWLIGAAVILFFVDRGYYLVAKGEVG